MLMYHQGDERVIERLSIINLVVEAWNLPMAEGPGDLSGERDLFPANLPKPSPRWRACLTASPRP